MYYSSRENRGSNCEADLHLCFRLYRLLVFPCGSSVVNLLHFINCITFLILLKRLLFKAVAKGALK